MGLGVKEEQLFVTLHVWLLKRSITACVGSPERLTFTLSYHFGPLQVPLLSPSLSPSYQQSNTPAFRDVAPFAALNEFPHLLYIYSLRCDSPRWAATSSSCNKSKLCAANITQHSSTLFLNSCKMLPEETKSNGQEPRHTTLAAKSSQGNCYFPSVFWPTHPKASVEAFAWDCKN